MRLLLTLLGLEFLVLWVGCWAVTIAAPPGSKASIEQWAAGKGLAFLAGGAFGASACFNKRKTVSPS